MTAPPRGYAVVGSVKARQHSKTRMTPTWTYKVAHRSPSFLSTKRQRSIFIFANQIIWGRSANIGLQ
jgi:hypothetical protein